VSIEQNKQHAVKFLELLEKADGPGMSELLAENFEMEMMGRLPGIAPIRGRQVFVTNMPQTIKAMFPNGLNMKIVTVIGEGPHVAIQAESDTTAGNGKKYANRYHFYFRFAGDKIEQAREYNDVNLVREVFFT